mgnify:CR=1 FL=1
MNTAKVKISVNGTTFLVPHGTVVDISNIEEVGIVFDTTRQQTWTVNSHTNLGMQYVVSFDGKEWSCECPHFEHTKDSAKEIRENCWHIKECKKKLLQ